METTHNISSVSRINSTASGRSFAFSCTCGETVSDVDEDVIHQLREEHSQLARRAKKTGAERSAAGDGPKNGAE